MKSAIAFITGNAEKFQLMESALKPFNIPVEQVRMELPEIQSMEASEVAEFSARWASAKLGRPCVVTDVGCYVRALNGFPGPFVRYVNETLSAADLLRLMEGKADRYVEFREYVSYATPEGEVKTFGHTHPGEVMETAAGNANLLNKPTPFNQIIRFEGCEKVMAEYSYAEAMAYFRARQGAYEAFAIWFSQQG